MAWLSFRQATSAQRANARANEREQDRKDRDDAKLAEQNAFDNARAYWETAINGWRTEAENRGRITLELQQSVNLLQAQVNELRGQVLAAAKTEAELREQLDRQGAALNTAKGQNTKLAARVLALEKVIRDAQMPVPPED